MAWMAPLVEEGHLQGKLCCPNCSSRFGNFNWAGLQCSCGCWVTPAFQVNVSRIDCMPPPAPLPKPPSLDPPPADVAVAVAVAQPANAAEAEGVAQVTDSVAAVTLSAPTGQ
jgi:dual specificity phosphatase 12